MPYRMEIFHLVDLPPLEFARWLRLIPETEMIEHDLLPLRKSLVDIAVSLKFSCQANFTRAFRQVTGQTPGQYRRSSC